MKSVRTQNPGRNFPAILLLLLFIHASDGWAQRTSSAKSSRPDLKRTTTGTPADSATSREDWSSISLAGGDLHAEKPLVGEKDKYPQFTRELIQLQWRTLDPIDLYVIRPRGVTKPPAVLYLYGYPSETDRFRDNNYCQRITRDGFAAIGFVSALTGHRYQNRPMREWFVSELQEALGSSVHDIQMILNYLAARGDLDMGHIGMFGEGSGATIAILAAAADQRIQALDLLDPWGDWPDWMAKSSLVHENERGNYLKPEFLKRVAPLDPVQWLPKLKLRSIRLQHVMDDSITPKSSKERIEYAAPAVTQIVRYQDTVELYKASSGGRLFDWIKEQMQPAPQRPLTTESLRRSELTGQAHEHSR